MENNKNNNKSNHKLSWETRIAYGSGDVACNVVFGMVTTVLTLFYTDYAGVSVTSVGLVMLIWLKEKPMVNYKIS